MFLLLRKGFVRLLRQILDCLKIQYSEVAECPLLDKLWKIKTQVV